MFMRIVLYAVTAGSIFYIVSYFFQYHNFRVWVVIIPFIIIEGLILWFKNNRKKKSQEETHHERYNDDDY